MILFPNSTLGTGLFFLSKAWLLAFPLVWLLAVDRARISFSPPRHGGWKTGALSGLLISGAIVALWLLLGPHLIDPGFVRAKMEAIGLTSLPRYLGMTVYWICINSLLEEYVWRWFVTEKFKELTGRFLPAVLLSAAAFTLHHIVAMLTFFAWPIALLCAFFIFIGGAIWSGLYLRCRSIWPPWLSHALVDLAIFAIAGFILFR